MTRITSGTTATGGFKTIIRGSSNIIRIGLLRESKDTSIISHLGGTGRGKNRTLRVT